MARDHLGPSHESTPKSVLNAPTPRTVQLPPDKRLEPSKRRRAVLERRARRTFSRRKR